MGSDVSPITVEIPPAELADLPGITAIYNRAVRESVSTFHVQPRTGAQQMDWFCDHDEHLPIIVARAGDAVVGWGALSLFSDRCAYARTLEDSVYVAEAHRRRGIGRRLLMRLVALAREQGGHSIVAKIASEMAPSQALHRAVGFQEVGRLREAGYKFDRWLDVTLMQLMLQ